MDHALFRTFLLVAETQSFTKAAAQLGVSRSAISHSINQLEQQLGIRLFQRTTRKVSLTDAGEQIFRQIQPLFLEIDHKISEVLGNYDRLQGTLKITGTLHALSVVLGEKFADFQRQYPQVTLELHSEMRFVDIVAERFDAGVRMGDLLAQDMVAVKVSEPMTMCCVSTPAYWAEHGKPNEPSDLAHYHCLRLRLPTHGGLLNWAFKHRDDTEMSPTLGGYFISNDDTLLLNACRNGQGIFWIERSLVESELQQGTLETALDDWAVTYPPYYLYYPNRNISPLLRALVDVLKG
ncbi:LysR family transcriptional regulator [Actinobacillus vicugnae]|uniref:LysR family transcriptional regulator n=1 Tax=Actinobacillus vicugnae TaxID=2573093 RepID=UPI001242B172|nr:LysR family transcriptional regulator [Actinobacillus vicugnae]